MLLKGEGESADHIVGGAEWSTLSHDAFPAQEFDFMLANPPYGKSWKKDLEAMGGKDGMRDPRFKVMHKGEELSLVTRSSDGQMLFLANMASKMNAQVGPRQPHRRGSQRLVAVHRRRRPGREQHPPLAHRERLARSHRRPAAQPLLQHRHRHLHLGAVQPEARAPQGPGAAHRRHASGSSRCARTSARRTASSRPRTSSASAAPSSTSRKRRESKIFPNAAFGYWKVTVERPLRLHSQLTLKAIETLRFASGDEDLRAALYEEFGDDLVRPTSPRSPPQLEKRLADWGSDDEEDEDEEGGGAKKGLPEKKKKKLLDPKTWERDGRLVEVATDAARRRWATTLFEDHNIFRDRVDAALKKLDIKLAAADLKQILKAVSWRVETAPPVIAKVHKPGKAKADPLRGLFEATVDGKPAIVEYEPDSDLRDTEQVPLLEDGGIEAFIRREVLPYTPDAWIKEDATKIGYEVSFTRHFYKPQPLRTLEEISADILAVEKEAGNLLGEIIGSK